MVSSRAFSLREKVREARMRGVSLEATLSEAEGESRNPFVLATLVI